jgi:hypothetical protein
MVFSIFISAGFAKVKGKKKAGKVPAYLKDPLFGALRRDGLLFAWPPPL